MYKIILRERLMFPNILNLFAFIFILTEAKLKLSYYTEMVVEESVLRHIFLQPYTPLLVTRCSYAMVPLAGSSKIKMLNILKKHKISVCKVSI